MVPFLKRDRMNRKLPLLADLYHLPEIFQVRRLAKRGERHNLVFVRRMQKAEILGHLFVEDTERMGHVDLSQPVNLVVMTLAVTRRRFFPSPIDCKDSRLPEG